MTTIVTGVANPNWPLTCIELDCTVGPPNTPGVNRRSINASYRKLQISQISINRGRQYELDQVQAGTATINVRDPLEYLNPDNTASPFNTSGNSIIPYRTIQIYSIWPNQPGSGNLINTTIKATYDPGFASSAGGWSPIAGSGTTVARSTAQAFEGTSSLQVLQAGSGAAYGAVNSFGLAPGIAYTFSCYVYPTGGCGVTAQVTAASGTVISSATVAAQNVWTRISATWTAVDTAEQIVIYGTIASAPIFYVDATQLEFGSAATAYTSTGPAAYNLFTGYVERWPTSYDMNGTRAVHPLVAVDALAIFSRIAISQSYLATIASDSPLLWIPYSDTGPNNVVWGAAAVSALATGTQNSTIIYPATRGIQDITAGGEASWAGDQTLDGNPAVAVTLGNSTGFAQPVGYMAVDIPHGFGYPVNSAGATFEGWLKWTSGHFHGLFFGFNPSVPSGTVFNETWGTTTNTFAGLVTSFPTGIQFYVNTVVGATTASVTVPAGSTGAFNNNDPSQFTGDNQWHYYAMVLRPNGSNNGWVLDVQVDGHTTTVSSSPAASGLSVYRFNQIMSEALLTFGDLQSKISVAKVAIYNAALSSTQRMAHYNRGVGYINELSGARAVRLFGVYWSGAVSVAPGSAKLAPDFQYDPTVDGAQARTLLDVLQEIAATERGTIYVDRNGTAVFEDRTSRYVSQSPKWRLGENPGGPAEFSYTEYAADFDPTYVFSQANLTRPGNTAFPPQPQPLPVNPPSGQRVVTQEVQVNTDYDLQQAAIAYLSRYALPRTRISTVTLQPSGNPAMWPTVLGFELSQRGTVSRRSPGFAISRDYYLEKVSHDIDFGNGKWDVQLQASPVFVSSAWVIGTSVLGTNTTPIY